MRDTRLAGLVKEFDRIAGVALFSGLLHEFRERPGFPEYLEALEQLEIQLKSSVWLIREKDQRFLAPAYER